MGETLSDLLMRVADVARANGVAPDDAELLRRLARVLASFPNIAYLERFFGR